MQSPPPMLKGAKYRTLLFAGKQVSTPLAARTPRQRIDLRQRSLRVSLVPPPYGQQNYVHQQRCRLLGQAAVHDTPKPGDSRDGKGTPEITLELTLASRDSRPRKTSGRGLSDDTKDNTRGHRPYTPTDRVNSPGRKEQAEQPLPDSSASRRHLLPAPGERHQLDSPLLTEHHLRHLGSPRSTECHPLSSHDRGAHGGPSDLDAEVARA